MASKASRTPSSGQPPSPAPTSKSSSVSWAGDFPIEESISPKERWTRLYLLGPLALTQQIGLFLCICSDFYDYSRADSKLLAVTVTLTGTPIRAFALGNFFVVLVLDLLFIFLSIYRKGLNKQRFKLLWPVCSHHIGFGLLSIRILSQTLQYVYGLSYVAFWSEFCFSLKILLNYYFTRYVADNDDAMNMTINEPSASNRNLRATRSQWQLRLLMLDLFVGGGGTFSAVFLYALILGDNTISPATQRNYTIIITLAIIYWLTQLLIHQRGLLERITGRLLTESSCDFQNLKKQSQSYMPSPEVTDGMVPQSARERLASLESHHSSIDLATMEIGNSIHSTRPRRFTEDSMNSRSNSHSRFNNSSNHDDSQSSLHSRPRRMTDDSAPV